MIEVLKKQEDILGGRGGLVSSTYYILFIPSIVLNDFYLVSLIQKLKHLSDVH